MSVDSGLTILQISERLLVVVLQTILPVQSNLLGLESLLVNGLDLESDPVIDTLDALKVLKRFHLVPPRPDVVL